ncbi:MAG: hypothetical protein ABEJ95_05020, partial [Candidatus Nanohalobium sp.]
STFKSREKAIMQNAELLIPQAIIRGEIDFKTPVKVKSIKTEDGYPELDQNDIYRQEEEDYLTLAPRIINLEEVMHQLKEIRKFIRSKVISDRLIKTDKGANFDKELIQERINEEVLQIEIENS